MAQPLSLKLSKAGKIMNMDIFCQQELSYKNPMIIHAASSIYQRANSVFYIAELEITL